MKKAKVDETAACRVLKFGGTSVGSPERLSQVLEIIDRAREEGPVAVVVSAMGRTTDHLLEAAALAARGDLDGAERIIDQIMDLTASNGLVILQQLEKKQGKLRHSPRITPLVRQMLDQARQLLYAISLLCEQSAQTLDLVLSFGERLSASVVAELLVARGVPAVFVDARRWTVTDAHFGAAMVDQEATRAKLAELAPTWAGKTPVTTGFLGQTPDGRTTTLGRNGSDYTATMLARLLNAQEVVIWSDVSGVMTADPGIVADAYPLSRLSYMEALELVDFGASLFHPRTMIPLIESGIPMRIRNTMQPDDPGTLIDARGASDETAATSVTSLENAALLDVQMRRISTRAQIGGRVLCCLEDAGLKVYMSSQSGQGQAVAIAVPMKEADETKAAIEKELALEIERGEVEPVRVRQPVTVLSLVAEAMGRRPNVDGRFFQALGAIGVQILAIAQGASSRSISCVIPEADTTIAVRTVHAAFNLAHQQVSVMLLGKGTVGGNLLKQIHDERARLERDTAVSLKVVGIADSRTTIFDEDGVDLEAWTEAIKQAPDCGFAGEKINEIFERLRRLPAPILVDCTGCQGMEKIYQDALDRGIHVVAANKKPLTLPWAQREQLMEAARRNHRTYIYSTTVGASLPVIETLKNLVRTGDLVQLIEGSFSGTLGYITNELMRGVKLSEAVKRAHELGYTEPMPQDDLSGMDVVRKALILTRELGLSLEVENVVVEPLIPREFLAPAPLDHFLAKLRTLDDEMSERVANLRRNGEVLRYLARVDPVNGGNGNGSLAHVGPIGVKLEHPAARLRGTEAFVAFTTERFHDYPLIVQGPGAGGVVTAAGVLSDILKISMTLRGR